VHEGEKEGGVDHVAVEVQLVDRVVEHSKVEKLIEKLGKERACQE
jgi:hypothetical protein